MKAGFSTCDGHLLTQRWHDVQCCWKRFWLTDPGGVIGFSFLYAFLPSIVAMDSCAFVRSVGAAPAVASPASRKRRLEESAATEDDSVATGCFSVAEERCCPFAGTETVETVYTAAIVNSVFFAVDTGSFAFGSAKSATITFCGIDTDFEQRVTAQKS